MNVLVTSSFAINGPSHATMYAVFLILSLSVGSAILLVLEMDRAFEGEPRISEKADGNGVQSHAAGRAVE